MVGTAPQNDFSGTLAEWEMRVFLNDDLYIVQIIDGVEMGGPSNRRRVESRSFPEPLKLARETRRSLLYATTRDRRNARRERTNWPSYQAGVPRARLRPKIKPERPE